MDRGLIPVRPPTAHDVARAAGVSQSAVSRAFTPGASISADMRARVEAAARRLGYRPNAVARSLTTGRSRTIGVAMAYLDNQFYPQVLEALSEELQARGYHVLLFTAAKHRDADPVIEQVLGTRVDAMLLASATLSSALARECRRAGVPVVLFNRTTADAQVSSVTGDNRGGGEAIAAFLHAGGHRRPAYIAGVANSSTNRDRAAGFLGWHTARGLPLPPVEAGDYTWHGAARAARLLLRRRQRPDAIFAANDHMALSVMDVARHELGLRIPDDLSVVGFDDTPPAAWAAYSLTSFSQPVEPMVAAATDLLMQLIADPAASPVHLTVPGRLVVRESTRNPQEPAA
jgi:DNA-binding LacI/PurR family transcriptional regulator